MSAAYNMFIVPVLIVFLATQKWFIKGLSGGLKL
jgi:ABC-type glycerol-3-phosphate transport system permease component